MNPITKTIMESITEYEEKFGKRSFWTDALNGGVFLEAKFHFLQSQIKVIESVVAGLEKAKITEKKGIVEMVFGDGRKDKVRGHTNMDVGYNKALEDQISSLEEVLKELT